MKKLARWGLWVLSLIMPVVIAACYGMPADSRLQRQKCGKTVDAATKAGISGIAVTCRRGLQELDMDYSGANGDFCVSFADDTPCETLEFADVDDIAGGGLYESQDVVMIDDGQSLTVEMVKK